jgi:hypothetical protein
MNSRQYILATLLTAIWIPAGTSAAGIDCLDTDAALEYWRPLKETATSKEHYADSLAPELVSCLGSTDAELRDRIGYELFTYWLREDKLSKVTRLTLLDALTEQLGDPSPDAALSRSFSALILAELMRADSNDSFMTAGQRQALLDSTVQAIDHETDFRGIDAELGWVHPIAHMADLLWRFALHPAITAEQSETLLAAVRSKVAPTEVSYAFNEGDRLARVVAVIIRRELIAAEDIAAWIGEFESPNSMDKWSQAFQSPAGMAELHNTKQFLRALSDQLAGVEIDQQISAVLESLVGGFTQLI